MGCLAQQSHGGAEEAISDICKGQTEESAGANFPLMMRYCHLLFSESRGFLINHPQRSLEEVEAGHAGRHPHRTNSFSLYFIYKFSKLTEDFETCRYFLILCWFYSRVFGGLSLNFQRAALKTSHIISVFTTLSRSSHAADYSYHLRGARKRKSREMVQ